MVFGKKTEFTVVKRNIEITSFYVILRKITSDLVRLRNLTSNVVCKKM